MNQPFASAQDAEDAFYDAFEAHDLEAMTAVWEAGDAVVCALPMAPLLQGAEEVRGAWEKLFQHDQRPEIMVHHVQWLEDGDLALHLVHEQISVPGMPQAMPPILASNVYRRGDAGWRMVMHQASPPPPPQGQFGLQPPGPPVT